MCAQMLMHAIARKDVWTLKESLHWKLTLGRKIPCHPGGIKPSSAAWRSDAVTNWAWPTPANVCEFTMHSGDSVVLADKGTPIAIHAHGTRVWPTPVCVCVLFHLVWRWFCYIYRWGCTHGFVMLMGLEHDQYHLVWGDFVVFTHKGAPTLISRSHACETGAWPTTVCVC